MCSRCFSISISLTIRLPLKRSCLSCLPPDFPSMASLNFCVRVACGESFIQGEDSSSWGLRLTRALRIALVKNASPSGVSGSLHSLVVSLASSLSCKQSCFRENSQKGLRAGTAISILPLSHELVDSGFAGQSSFCSRRYSSLTTRNTFA